MPAPDPIFAEPRLAAVYDAFDGERDDLDLYEAIVDELGARRVLDVGCGTGSFAVRLAARGLAVTGVDPAAASLDLARAKPHADRVRWIDGDASAVTDDGFDVATMTGNVAQVFLTDDAFTATLAAVSASLRPGGHLVFEVRDPARRAWEGWTPDRTRTSLVVDGVGAVEAWTEVTSVELPLVSFRQTYRFALDGAVLVSDSTLRFRRRDELDAALDACGFDVDHVRDAPDRPGLEWVVVARRR